MTHRPALLSPGKLGTLELLNRIFRSAVGTDLANEDGNCGDRIGDCGGFGYIVGAVRSAADVAARIRGAANGRAARHRRLDDRRPEARTRSIANRFNDSWLY
jgi:hypothetical protein